ncbi:phospholipase D family protein [Staphylococcus haemolyticus]|uniref:phospholipase D family protein n=1 Tax=Staphylococcus haemolyticus TaxID=1283 RepID=UPI0034DD3488
MYSNVLKENCVKFKTLNIISGYASASFLTRIIDSYPQLNINLYIGMSQEGIITENHNKYIQIMNKHDRVNVYYQVIGELTHIKLYSFSKEEVFKNFMGSANFTENGLIYNNELLCEFNDSINKLLKKQHENSMLCNSPNIRKYINFVDNKLQSEDKYNEMDKIRSKIEYFNKQNDICSNINTEMTDKYIKLPIVIPKKASFMWETSGINAKFGNKFSHLVMSNYNSSKLQEFFNEELVNYIYDFENTNMFCELKGTFNRELHFIDMDIYDYFRKLIGLKEITPITHEHLEYFGYKYFTFKKIEQNKYLLTFTN